MTVSRPTTVPFGMPSLTPAARQTACPRTGSASTGWRGTRRRTYLLVITGLTLPVVFLLAIASVIAAAGNVLPPHGRALSLRVLLERVQDCQPQGNCDEVVLHLAGLKRIHGYVVDTEQHDLVLVGQAEPAAWPALHLQDLVIALRDAWQRYAVTRGNVRYLADPGVSIDPHPQVIAQLQRIGEALHQHSGEAAQEKSLAAWHATCHQPQQTRAEGIPFDTHFTSVMLQADYDLKRFVDGSEPLAIEGFSSLAALYLDAAKRALKAGKAAQLSLTTMSRFWFSPARLMLKEQPGVVLIDRFGIKLLTEEEHLSQQGQIVGKGAAAPLAAQWAQMVTHLYPHIAAQRPVFRELENLAWLVALARTLKFREAPTAAGLSLEWLLTHFAVPETPVPRTVPGHSNVHTYQYREAVAGGYVVGGLLMPSCGGVHLAVEVKGKNFSRDRGGQLARVKQAVHQTRSGNTALSWDF